jgi:endonuclease/exonuclease/phosphatase family metal-dependent hydrolase
MPAISALIKKIMSYFTVLTLVFTAAGSSPLKNPSIETKAAGTVRIMSFNVRCTNVGTHSREDRVDSVTGAIETVMPDLLGVQEATPEWMSDLKARLPAYACIGVGRDDGVDKGEYSAIFYLKDKYEMVDSGTFWLSDTPDTPSRSWTSFLKRICTWAVLKDRATGKDFLYMNTHFDNAFTPRKNSIPLILEKAAEFENIPVICTGDFNTIEISPLYVDLLAGSLSNAKYSAADTMSVITTTAGLPLGRLGCFTVDHILVNSKVEPKVYRVVTQKFDNMLPSDHYPIYADVILNYD